MCKLKMLLLQKALLAEAATLLFMGYGLLRKKVSKVCITSSALFFVIV